MQHNINPENTTWEGLYTMYLKQQADNIIKDQQIKNLKQQVDILKQEVMKHV